MSHRSYRSVHDLCLRLATLAAVVLPCISHAAADDWPQWMGPNRDNRWTEEGIVEKFPEAGLETLWSTPVGIGYAGPAVAEGRVFVPDLVTEANVKDANFQRGEAEGTERLVCLDAASGEVLWQHGYPVKYSISYPSGPRCTPLIDEGLVYFLGAEGKLTCLGAADGKLVWERDLKTDYRTTTALWGYAAHPLIDGEKLITLAGGEGSHIVALNKKTGEEIWRSGTAPEQGYSPQSIIEAGGARQLIVTSPVSVYSVDPETGKIFWSERYDATSGSIIMTPVYDGKHLFVGGFQNRNLMLEMAEDQPAAKVLFKDRSNRGLSPVNVQPFLEDGVMYGIDGDGMLIAAELPSGQRLWETPQPLSERPMKSATAFIVKQGERYFMFTEAGELIIAKMDREGFTEIDRAKILEPTNSAMGRSVVWSPPAYANGCIYARNDEKCVCVDLRAASYR